MYLENKVPALTLHIPAAWNSKDNEGRFEDNGKTSQSNPGKVANKLHKTFSEQIKEETLVQIETCRHLGAKLEVHDGFKKRNDSVAKSQYLIAFSWGNGEAPSKGGTLDTWNKCEGKKLHIPLSSLEKLTNPNTCQDPCSSVEGRKIPTSHVPCTSVALNSAEMCGSAATTHAELCQLRNLNQSTCSSSNSKELPPTAANFPPLEYTSKLESLDSGVGSLDSGVGSLDSGVGSLDSGLGSLDALDSGVGSLDHFESMVSVERTQSQHKCCEGQNKRRRSESADILDNSDVECDGIKAKHTIQSLSKKRKVSDFAKHALNYTK